MKNKDKDRKLLILYQKLIQLLDMSIAHDTTDDSWGGCIEFEYISIDDGITNSEEAISILKKIKELEKENENDTNI